MTSRYFKQDYSAKEEKENVQNLFTNEFFQLKIGFPTIEIKKWKIISERRLTLNLENLNRFGIVPVDILKPLAKKRKEKKYAILIITHFVQNIPKIQHFVLYLFTAKYKEILKYAEEGLN